MKHYAKVAILFSLAAIVLGCNVPIKHYETMKCTPVKEDGSNCPKRFNCPSISQHDNSKCYFNGKIYSAYEQIPNELVYPFCSALCNCQSQTPFAQFQCTHIDCPEFFQKFDYENCVRTYKPKSCCSSGKICGEEKLKSAKCTVNGKTFLPGERMYPESNKCLTCICHPEFNEANIGSDPNCYESTCTFELFDAKRVYNGAVPVYYEERCCPWEWRMPKDTDQIANSVTNEAASDPALQCKYGKLTLNIGDSLKPEVTDEYTYNCSCSIPPLAQCVKTKNKA